MAYQIALYHVTFNTSQVIYLLLFLYTLGHNLQIELLCHCQYGFDYIGAVYVNPDLCYKYTVDLESVYRQACELPQ